MPSSRQPEEAMEVVTSEQGDRQKDRYAPIDTIPDTFLYAHIPPNLLDYGETSNCCTVPLQEAEIYEVLQQHPHPNNARYHGCVVENGRFRGIYLQRYSITLKQRIERHPKAKDDGKPALSETEKRRLVQGIRDGVAHLHLLGLVHNGLNPSNVMVEDDAAIVIDFDSCRRHERPDAGDGGPSPSMQPRGVM